MARLRFATAVEVFEAFPRVSEDIKAKPSPEAPPTFMRTLAAGETPEDAVTFCAYALGRREAVWWGCQSVRSIEGIGEGEEDSFLRAAEDWVKSPEEEQRRFALQLGIGNDDKRTPGTWLALAAGWSGGSMSPVENAAVAPPPYLTALGVRSAILIALARVNVKERARRLAACVDSGLRMMQGDAA